MEMADALTKFYDHIEKPETNVIFFKYDNIAYQICFCGHYIRTENLILGLKDEYCFPETGKALTAAFLNAKVNEDKDKIIREILSELSDNDLGFSINQYAHEIIPNKGEQKHRIK